MVICQYVIICIITALSLMSLFYLKKQKKDKTINIFLLVLASVLTVLFVIRYMSGDDSISSIFALNSDIFNNKFLNFVSLIFNWIFMTNILLVILNQFFGTKEVENIIRIITFPISILTIVAIVPMSIGIVGRTQYYSFNFRTIIMAIELSLVLVYSFWKFWENNKFRIEKSEIKDLFFVIILFLSVIPSYALKALFGYSNISTIKDFTFVHRLILYLSILIPILLYLLLIKKSEKFKKFVILFICVATMNTFTFNHKFSTFTSVTSWPFHLCNTAMYLITICLIFKWDRLFYFTYFINVLGAFLAMAMPNYSVDADLFSSGILNFYINHYIAFFMPILIVALGIYKRPNKKTFYYASMGFLAYFVFILIINAWFSNYAKVDYFFVNSDFIADKLGTWAENLRNVTLQFSIGSLSFKFFPLYQFLFWLVYQIIAFGIWFLYELGYSFVDRIKDTVARNKKINLDILAYNLNKKEGNMSDKKLETKLIINHFSKRYGNSSVYAVHDFSLEINKGEIFGLLGPNGAGKSTIIKSLVGIQSITSGEISMCGFDIAKEPVSAKMEIGFVPDHYALYEKLTGREYINYIADLYDVSLEDRTKRISKYLNLFQLEYAFDNPMKTYSHGMKQKIAIMSALIHNPKIWILDEPLTGLDPDSIFAVKECMKNHAKAGNIVLFSSHLMDVVERLCDKVAIIKNGHLLIVDDLKNIEKNYEHLEDFYMQTIATNVSRDKVSKKDEKSEKISDSLISKEKQVKTKKENQ